jgi:large subunit ribosomal protein L1
MVRGVVTLPNGTGKETRSCWFFVLPIRRMKLKVPVPISLVLDEYIEKIKGGWTDVDVIITMPSVMGKVGALGRILGPRGLMPNPKTGTVTMDVGKPLLR